MKEAWDDILLEMDSKLLKFAEEKYVSSLDICSLDFVSGFSDLISSFVTVNLGNISNYLEGWCIEIWVPVILALTQWLHLLWCSDLLVILDVIISSNIISKISFCSEVTLSTLLTNFWRKPYQIWRVKALHLFENFCNNSSRTDDFARFGCSNLFNLYAIIWISLELLHLHI